MNQNRSFISVKYLGITWAIQIIFVLIYTRDKIVQEKIFSRTNGRRIGQCSTFYAGLSRPRRRKRGTRRAEVHDMKASLCREEERERERDATRRNQALFLRAALRKRGQNEKKRLRPDNRPILPLVENTENRESTSLLLSLSFGAPFSLHPLLHISRFPGIPRDL